jgi:N-formylglutamate amidohydrolase
VGPPIGPGAAVERPWICLSNADRTCPADWLRSLAACLEDAFKHPVSVNEPFKGGFIIQSHARELPWVQLELSRAPFLPDSAKRARVLGALREWTARTAKA